MFASAATRHSGESRNPVREKILSDGKVVENWNLLIA
jgi:hypothetical protein